MGLGVSDWLHLIPRDVRSDLVDAYWFEQIAEENGRGESCLAAGVMHFVL